MSDDDRSYEVGKGKPPLHGRIKLGEHRNPNGRPRGSKNVATVLRKAAYERVPFTERGRRGTISKLEAAAKQLFSQAAQGKLSAIKLALALLAAGDRPMQTGDPVDEAARLASDAEILKALRQRLAGLDGGPDDSA